MHRDGQMLASVIVIDVIFASIERSDKQLAWNMY